MSVKVRYVPVAAGSVKAEPAAGLFLSGFPKS